MILALVADAHPGRVATPADAVGLGAAEPVTMSDFIDAFTFISDRHSS